MPAPALQARARPGGAVIIGSNFMALGVARSLGRRGIPVWVLHDEYVVATASRYVRRSLPWADANEIGYLLDLATQHRLRGWVLFPVTDKAAGLLSRHRTALADCYRLTSPGWEVMQYAYDKRLTYKLAAEVGVDYPTTYYPNRRDDLLTLDCAFPIILKPAVKEGHNAFTDAKAWRVDDRAQLLAGYEEACRLVDPCTVMVQELIPGRGEAQFSFAALCREGCPVGSLLARRVRQFPVDFGRTSTYVETIDHPEVEQAARRLLAALNFTGLVEIEFKYDSRTRRYKLLDINARVWGWHTLGRRAGVDFPYLQWRMAHGQPVENVRARAGVRWVHMTTDILAAGAEIRRGQLLAGKFIRSLRPPIEHALFAADDPLPALMEVPLMAHSRWLRHTG